MNRRRQTLQRDKYVHTHVWPSSIECYSMFTDIWCNIPGKINHWNSHLAFAYLKQYYKNTKDYKQIIFVKVMSCQLHIAEFMVQKRNLF